MRTLPILLVSSLLWSLSATAAAPDAVKEDVERSKKLSRRSVERDAKAKPGEEALGCKTLRDEARALCRDAILRGHKGNCGQVIVGLNMSVQQAKGALFDVEGKHGAAAGSNARAAESACRVHIRSLRRDREKHDASMGPEGAAGTECQALAAQMDAVCWAALDAGEMPDKCSRAVQMLRYAGNQKPEDLCKIGASMLAQ